MTGQDAQIVTSREEMNSELPSRKEWDAVSWRAVGNGNQ